MELQQFRARKTFLTSPAIAGFSPCGGTSVIARKEKAPANQGQGLF
jgi:hypothetical protein